MNSDLSKIADDFRKKPCYTNIVESCPKAPAPVREPLGWAFDRTMCACAIAGQRRIAQNKMKGMYSMSTEYPGYYHFIKVNEGETVHLRSSTETNTNNVITELPRGYQVVVLSTWTPWKEVEVDDGINTIQGFVHENYLSTSQIQISDDDRWIPRYSTPIWKSSRHSGNYYLPVKRIQEDLYRIGYTEVGEADGYYGPNTDKAVRAFQRDYKLSVDGQFGNNSKAALWNDVIQRG